MSIFSWLGNTLGGWRTWGPNAPAGLGAFATPVDYSVPHVSEFDILCNSAAWACRVLRAEVIGTLPVQVRDANKKVLPDHPVAVLLNSPNSLQTRAEFLSMQVNAVDQDGNGLSHVIRRRDKSIIAIEPFGKCAGVQLLRRPSGGWYYDIGGQEYDAADVLHLKGFSVDGMWGLSRYQVGSQILGAQLAANQAALAGFKQSLKVGGFFEVDKDLDRTQLADFKTRLDEYGKAENSGKWMSLLKGMKPVQLSTKLTAAENQILESRGYGIEEICRLYGVPPQLIYHTDKASSWASSIENINLFFLMYSLQPTFVRFEQRMEKTLLSVEDRARGVNIKFNINGLVRADTKTRFMMYASALQNRWLTVNEVRDLEDRIAVEGGDEFAAPATNTPKPDEAVKKLFEQLLLEHA